MYVLMNQFGLHFSDFLFQLIILRLTRLNFLNLLIDSLALLLNFFEVLIVLTIMLTALLAIGLFCIFNFFLQILHLARIFLGVLFSEFSDTLFGVNHQIFGVFFNLRQKARSLFTSGINHHLKSKLDPKTIKEGTYWKSNGESYNCGNNRH